MIYKLFSFLCFFLTINFVFSQDYKLETIELWNRDSIPFNKENISYSEELDSAGVRYSKISVPMLYVYKKNAIINNGAALLFCPGGGYAKVTIGKNNGEGTAKYFLKMGFDVVCILKYRLPDTLIVNHQEKVPLCDAQKALSIVNKNASKWAVDNEKIAVMGSSAGGHLAASLANLKEPIIAPNVKEKDLKIAASILLYPVISFNLPHRHKGSYKRLLANESDNKQLLDYYSMENQVKKDTPPTFIVHALDDQSVTYHNSVIYSKSLKNQGIKYQYLPLEKGGHGFGLNFNKTGVDWTIQLKQWLKTEINLLLN